MAESRWVYELASGRFLRGGFYRPDINGGEGVAVFPDADAHPDATRERYDATSPRLRRLATQAELAADAVDARAAAAQREMGQDAIRATVELLLRRVLGRTPTAQERQAAADEWRTIYRALS